MSIPISPDTAILQQPGPVPTEKPIVSPNDFGGWQNVFQFVVPPGIGDLSWIYSKLKHLKDLTGKETIIYFPPGEGRHRGNDLISILPGMHYGGELNGQNSALIVQNTVPSNYGDQGWISTQVPVVLAPNHHLESGQSLANWLPSLPTDYHYQLGPWNINHVADGGNILNGISEDNGFRRNVVAVYTHNRHKDDHYPEWAMWKTDEWVDFLDTLKTTQTEFAGCSFLLLGAEWDRDKTTEVASKLVERGHKTHLLIAQPLQTAFECLQRCKFCISYPSGIGIMANVLRTPTLMMLPAHLRGLENTYADPEDIAAGRYRAWVKPTTQEALAWIESTKTSRE